MTRWNCKLCSDTGLGGPKGWERHVKYRHTDNGRYSAQIAFGFTGDYSSGKQRRIKITDRPVVAEFGDEHD